MRLPAPKTDGPTRRKYVELGLGTRASVRVHRRLLVALVLTSGFTVFAVAFTLVIGQDPVPLGQVVKALVHQASPYYQLIVGVLRLPRVLTAVLVGACLGMSGAIFQSVSGNGLVSPDIIGINTGASLCVVVAVVIGGANATSTPYAVAGALAVAVIDYSLSLRHGLSRYRMVLIGIGVNATLGAFISFLYSIATQSQLETITFYLTGSLQGATFHTVIKLLIPSVILLTAGTALGSQLVVLTLGDVAAVGLGARVVQIRSALLAVGVGLSAFTVVAAGPIGFVAFIAPHIARRLAHSAGNGLLPLSAAVGAAVVVVADYVGQRIIEPYQIPVGIMTSLIGAPYFLFLLVRAAKNYAV